MTPYREAIERESATIVPPSKPKTPYLVKAYPEGFGFGFLWLSKTGRLWVHAGGWSFEIQLVSRARPADE